MTHHPIRLFRLSVALLLLLAALPAAAQPRGGGGAALPRLDALAERLDLTDAQVDALDDLFSDAAERGRAWHEANPDASREARRAFRSELRTETLAAVRDVLTPEQRARLERLLAGREGRRDRGRRAGHPLHRLARHLDLSEAQQETLRDLFAEQREAAAAWRAANPDATPGARRAFRAEQRDEAVAAVESVLSPEQQETLREALTRHDGRRHGPHGLAEALDLTDAQREAVRTWRAANPEATGEAWRAFRRDQAEAFERDLVAVLTPDQAERYRALVAGRRERREAHREGRRSGGRTERSGERRSDRPEPGAAAPTSSAFDLSNHPNPFNPTTEIRFTLPEAAAVTLTVYDVQGREVTRLVDGPLGAGSHSVAFTADGLPTGTYLYRLTAGSAVETGRMVLVK